MNEADRNARRNVKGEAANRLANSARLAALGRNLGIDIKRHRDPGGAENSNPWKEQPDEKEETVLLASGF